MKILLLLKSNWHRGFVFIGSRATARPCIN